MLLLGVTYNQISPMRTDMTLHTDVGTNIHVHVGRYPERDRAIFVIDNVHQHTHANVRKFQSLLQAVSLAHASSLTFPYKVFS